MAVARPRPRVLLRRKSGGARGRAQGRHSCRARFTGRRISESEDPDVFLTESGDVIVYDPQYLHYTVCQDAEEDLRDQLAEVHYIEAMNALGITPTVDLKFE